jgi:hypothetical protein
MQIVTRIPRLCSQKVFQEVELSKVAKFRLKVLDWYRNSSAIFSKSGKPEVKLTCRHFGIHRSYFYRWIKRFDPRKISTLENKSCRPHKKNVPRYSSAIVKSVQEIREVDQTYSGKKIRAILLRSFPEKEVPSVASIGRLIKRKNFFFRADSINLRKKKSNSTKKMHERKRKPYGLKPEDGHEIIEFDMKHVYQLGIKHYAFCATNVTTKEAIIHVATSSSSLNAKTCAEKIVSRWGKKIFFINDNGSENMGKTEEYLREQEISQYWTRPYQPKDNPCIESFIRTFQKECLDYNYDPMNATELNEVVRDWLDKYHYYRPHESLDMMTPAEFSAKLGITIPKGRVSYR